MVESHKASAVRAAPTASSLTAAAKVPEAREGAKEREEGAGRVLAGSDRLT